MKEWTHVNDGMPEIDRPLRLLLHYKEGYSEDLGYMTSESQGEYGETEIFFFCYGNGEPIDDQPVYWSYIHFPEHPEIPAPISIKEDPETIQGIVVYNINEESNGQYN